MHAHGACECIGNRLLNIKKNYPQIKTSVNATHNVTALPRENTVKVV